MWNCSENCESASGVGPVFLDSRRSSTLLCPGFGEPNVVPPTGLLVDAEPTHGFVVMADAPPCTLPETIRQEHPHSVLDFPPSHFELHARDLVANAVPPPPSLKPFGTWVSYQFRQVTFSPIAALIVLQCCTQLPRLRHEQ